VTPSERSSERQDEFYATFLYLSYLSNHLTFVSTALAKFASIAINEAHPHCISSLTIRLATRLAIRFFAN
jgi:hypothetical protein